ncbi:TPA: RNA-DNA hybrid ribonuclease [Trebouxia sp. C0006]
MAWGVKGGRGVEDLVERLARDDPSLTSLHVFASRKFGREGVQELVDGIKENSTLQKLDLENKGISSKGAASIAAAIHGHQSLQQLVLAHNHLSDEGVRLLQPALALLRRLDLRECNIGSQGAQCIATALRETDSLEVLRLDDNPLAEQGGSTLAAGVWQCQSLRELHLCNTGIGDEGLSRLAQALPHASQLTYLDVSACSIGDEGVSDLADAISDPFHGIADKAMLNEEFHGAAPTPAHLQVLKLRDNKISDCGVKELGEAIQQSSSLQDLDLAGNQVGIQGLNCLSASTLKHPSPSTKPVSVLQKLCLFNCKLGQEASDTIVSCFKDKGFNNLQELDLAGNEIDAPQMQSILEAVQQQGVTPALKVLIIGGNPAAQTDSFSELVAKTRAARPSLDIAWQATDPGQGE